jgi:L-seryl-tRNA(Ser) seleniumtransferase
MDPRSLPAIGRLLARDDVRALAIRHGREAVTEALRAVVGEARSTRGAEAEAPTPDEVVARASAWLGARARGTLVPVLNATGVVLHTNVGRASLAASARAAAAREGAGYASIELDLDTGARGSRHVHAAARLARLTGAEDALVANNAAAALTLALAALAPGGEVIVSRGELVEIGGAFRIPEIVEAGGARLREVGTTNRTRVADYARALGVAGEGARLLLKVHRSNFAIVGFTEEATVAELAALGDGASPPAMLVVDLGSGLLVPGRSIGLPDEPDVAATVAGGASVVIFSGDKLLGGPQAGIAVGRRDAIAAMRAHPLMRALRCGKLVLAALDATLAIYERSAAREEIPTLRAIAASREEVRAKAERLRAAIGAGARGDTVEIVETEGRVGGGAQPLRALPSAALRLPGDAEALARALREGTPAVIGRIEDGALLLDPRAIDEAELDVLAARVRGVLGARDGRA